MIAHLVPRPPAPIAASVLRDLFAQLRTPLAFRLWDGREVRVGQGPPVATVVIRAPETFARLMDDPSPGRFAEAYVEQAVEIEGDLFQIMAAADEADAIRLTLGQKLRILGRLLLGGRRVPS